MGIGAVDHRHRLAELFRQADVQAQTTTGEDPRITAQVRAIRPMNPTALLSEVWALLSPKVRRGLLTVIGTALVIILVMFAYLAYSTGEVYRRTGYLPTREDLNEQTDTVVGSVKDVSEQVQDVAVALSVYKDSLAHLRSHVDTTLIAPGLMAIVDLQRRMDRVERGGVETRLAIIEAQNKGAQSNAQLIAQMSRQSSAEARAKEREQQREQEQREKDRALMEAIAKKLKIDTKEF